MSWKFKSRGERTTLLKKLNSLFCFCVFPSNIHRTIMIMFSITRLTVKRKDKWEQKWREIFHQERSKEETRRQPPLELYPMVSDESSGNLLTFMRCTTNDRWNELLGILWCLNRIAVIITHFHELKFQWTLHFIHCRFSHFIWFRLFHFHTMNIFSYISPSMILLAMTCFANSALDRFFMGFDSTTSYQNFVINLENLSTSDESPNEQQEFDSRVTNDESIDDEYIGEFFHNFTPPSSSRSSTPIRRRTSTRTSRREQSAPYPAKQKKKMSKQTNRNRIDCPVCLETVKSPVSTKCGHIFCSNCLIKSLVHEKRCPICKQAVKTRFDYHRIFI